MRYVYILILFFFVAGVFQLRAQQDPQYTQYILNPYFINPAVAGTNNYFQIRSIHRFQWVNLASPPITNTLSIYGPMERRPMGFGGYVFNDIAGAIMKTNVMGTYAYNYAITDKYNISMGMHAGFSQYRIDGTRLDYFQEEINWENRVYNKLLPDATLGVYFYSSTLCFGVSTTQLFNTKIKSDVNISTEQDDFGRLKSHFFITGGYKYFINQSYALEAAFLLKEVYPMNPQYDLTLKMYLKNILWGGMSYRTGDAISVMIGYTHKKYLQFGYCYDINISPFRDANTQGSHEFMIGYKFDPVK